MAVTARPIRLAIVGLGKIARDQHLPAIAGDRRFALAATVDLRAGGVADGVPHFASLAAMRAAGCAVDAVSLCTPPQRRYPLAVEALRSGHHVFLEKPPGSTVGEVAALRREAEAAGVSLFAGWHSRHAFAVDPARAWLATRRIEQVRVRWREDVRRWHPGQAWVWEAGGLGVFDPGINALSILTAILPGPLFVTRAALEMPANRATPIAATLELAGPGGATVAVDLDWRQEGPQTWEIGIATDGGTCRIMRGGAALAIAGREESGPDREYPALYARFADLIDAGGSGVDVAPLQLVADAFLVGERHVVAPFHDEPVG